MDKKEKRCKRKKEATVTSHKAGLHGCSQNLCPGKGENSAH